MSTGARDREATAQRHAAPPGWTRRALLLGGVGAGAAAVANVGGAGAAQAAGDPLLLGDANYADGALTALGSSNPTNTFFVTNNNPTAGPNGTPWTLLAAASIGTCVVASATQGTGVKAHSNTGPGVVASSGSGPTLRLESGLGQPPTTGNWLIGSLVATTGGELWLCVATGTPGVWRRISGPSSAGDFVPITPTRVYDSRRAQPGPATKIVPGTPRVVSVKDGRDLSTGAVTTPDLVPPGTLAIAANITVTATEGGGWLCASPGNAGAVTASSLNWNRANESVANGLALRLDSQRQLKIFVATSATHVIVDVNGYYRAK